MVTLTLWSGARITVRTETVEAFRELDGICKRWNYVLRKSVTGAYNCRRITGGSGYSLHAYGIAADFNWDTNPYGPKLVTDMPRGMVDEILAIRTNGGHEVFGWGGNYRNNKDAMHYEIVASPAELATGIQGGALAPRQRKDQVMNVVQWNGPQGDGKGGAIALASANGLDGIGKIEMIPGIQKALGLDLAPPTEVDTATWEWLASLAPDVSNRPVVFGDLEITGGSLKLKSAS